MGYYIRVLGKRTDLITLNRLREVASPALIEVAGGDEERWTQLLLKHESGKEIALVERNPVRDGETGQEEIQEFMEEIEGCKPASAVAWLKNYLPSVEVVYSLQVLFDMKDQAAWKALHAVQSAIWNSAGGIFQSDGEGFTEEKGYTILWQFSDHVTGPWHVAVRDGDQWKYFQMSLGNRKHRKAFINGEVPEGVVIKEV